MSTRTLRIVATEQCVLATLTDGPLSAREISDALTREHRQAWCDRHGYTIEWGTGHEPLAARLLAHCEAEENGCVSLMPHEVYRVVRRLEARGAVDRIQIMGRRPVLWREARGV